MMNKQQYRSQQYLRVGRTNKSKEVKVRANSNDDLEDVVSGEQFTQSGRSPQYEGSGGRFQPILKRHNRNRSRQNLHTAIQKDQLINADINNGRNSAAIQMHTQQVDSHQHLRLQQHPLGVRQFVRPGPMVTSPTESNFSSGINKLMAKINDMKTELRTETSNVYSEHPGPGSQMQGRMRTSSNNRINRGKQVIRKGQMKFQERANECFDKRPNANSFMTSPLERNRLRHQPFQFHQPHEQQKSQTQMQGETGQSFEYLVNRVFLKNENKELDQQASRLTKLNALCQQATQDVKQIKKEVRQGNFEMTSFSQVAAGIISRENTTSNGSRERGNVNSASPNTSGVTPLQAVSRKMKQMYSTQDLRTSHANQNTIQLPNIMTANVTNIGGGVEYLSDDVAQDSGGSQSPDTMPTMSKTNQTRAPTDAGQHLSQQSMAMRRKRVQSAVNRNPKKVAGALMRGFAGISAIATTQNEEKDEAVTENTTPFGNRRTQSAVFKPFNMVANSLSKLEKEQSTNWLSNVRSSHPFLALGQDSFSGAAQISPDQMVALLTKQVERQLESQPDALNSESNRKQLLSNAIKKMFMKEPQTPSNKTAAQESTPKLINTVGQQQAQNAQARLEKISEGFKPVAATAKTGIQNSLTIEKDQSVMNLESCKHDSIKTEQLKHSGQKLDAKHRLRFTHMKNSEDEQAQNLEKRKSQITVKVTDIEAILQLQQKQSVSVDPTPPILAPFKSFYAPVQKLLERNNTNKSLSRKGSMTKSAVQSPMSATSSTNNKKKKNFSFFSTAAPFKKAKPKQQPSEDKQEDYDAEKQDSVGTVDMNMMAQDNPMFQSAANSQFDDDDYAFNAQKRAKDYSKKLTAISYDTSALKNRGVLGLEIQPVLLEKGRSPSPIMTRKARMSMLSSEQADLKLGELYRNTIDEFKKKLYEKKTAPAVLSRIHEMHRSTVSPSKVNSQNPLSKTQQLPNFAGIIDLKEEGEKRAKRGPPDKKLLKKTVKKSPKRSPKRENLIQVPKEEIIDGQKIEKKDSARSRKSSAESVKSKKSAKSAMSVKPKKQPKRTKSMKGVQVPLVNNEQRSTPEDGSKTQSKNKSGTQGTTTPKLSSHQRKRPAIISTGSAALPRKQTFRSPLVVSDQEIEAPTSPINIQVQVQMMAQAAAAANANPKSGSPLKKKKSRLLDMIKSYEEEKLRQKLTKIEKDFLAEIDQILGPNLQAIQEQQALQQEGKSKEKSKKLADNLGNQIMKKFLPPGLTNLGSSQKNLITQLKDQISETPEITDQINKDDPLELGKAEDGLLSLMSTQNDSGTGRDRRNKSPLGYHKSATLSTIYPQLEHKKLTRTSQKLTQKTHFSSNVRSIQVNARKKFFFAQLDQWDNRTKIHATDLLEKGKNQIGDFDDNLDEPLEMHTRLPDNEVGFLSDLAQDELYELEKGFIVNNSYIHGRKMVIDKYKWDTTLTSLQTRDPRLTKSATDLLALLDVNDDDQEASDQNEDEQKPQDKRMNITDSWFKYDETHKFSYAARDDLHEYLQRSNLQLYKSGDLDDVKQVALKAEREEEEFNRKITSISFGEIANLYHAECDIIVQDGVNLAKLEERVEEFYGQELIEAVERIGLIARSPLVNTKVVQQLEEEFRKQDALVPVISKFIRHIDNLIYVQFPEVDENLPKDVSVEIQRAGFTRVPVNLTLAKIVKKDSETPFQLLWILKMSDLLQEAISSWCYSPFKPAPILDNFKIEFNLLKINFFQPYLTSLLKTEIIKLPSEFCFYRSKLMKGMLAIFNDQARTRYDYQSHLAIRFSRPLMRRTNREALLQEGKFFIREVSITNAEEIQFFKRSKGMSDIVEARRENAMELYIQHDVGPVINHFHEKESESCYRSHVSRILSHCIDTSNMKHSLGSIFSEEDSNSSNDSENLTGSHRSMFSTAARLLERLKMSPSKSRLKKKRPWALKGLEKPMCRQLSPTKIRLNHQGGWDARGRAVIVVDQHAQGLIRVPIRLHEQFQYEWTYRLVTFEEPRPLGYSLHHEILPYGHKRSDLIYRDFCFYDIIEPFHTPELAKKQQQKLDLMLGKRLVTFRSQAVKRQSTIISNIVDPIGSLMQADLSQPSMMKTGGKKSGRTNKKKKSKKGKKNSTSKQASKRLSSHQSNPVTQLTVVSRSRSSDSAVHMSHQKSRHSICLSLERKSHSTTSKSIALSHNSRCGTGRSSEHRLGSVTRSMRNGSIGSRVCKTQQLLSEEMMMGHSATDASVRVSGDTLRKHNTQM